MESFELLPDATIHPCGAVSAKFLELGVQTFLDACRLVSGMPYGYNSDRDEPLILFREGRGTCTTKHSTIAELAVELGLPVEKRLGVYPMTEALVSGAGEILAAHHLPSLPMLHCFLGSGAVSVDLTEGNRNGKNGPIDEFFHTAPVEPNISAKEEYLFYRRALTEVVLKRPEFSGIKAVSVLRAREEGLELLRRLVAPTIKEG